MSWLSSPRKATALVAAFCAGYACSPSSVPSSPSTQAVTAVSIGGMTPGVGATSQFVAAATLSDNSKRNVTSLASWHSSDPQVATVTNGGLVTAVALGIVEITATYQSVVGRASVDVESPNRFLFDIAQGVAPADRAVIREGLDLAQEFFEHSFGQGVSSVVTVHVTDSAGAFPAFASGSELTFNTRHQVWTTTASLNKIKIAIHELFHVAQQGQSAPRWFREGSAEFVAYQGLSYAGLLAYETARGCQIFSMTHGVDPSLTLRDGGIPPNGGYWLALLGIDYMSGSSIQTFSAIHRHQGVSWDSRMQAVVGLSADDFYSAFELERRRYQVPHRYECPA